MAFTTGPLSGFLAACAASVATGIVLGGFAAGVVGLLRGWERREFDFRVVKSGYGGGAFGLVAMAFDSIVT